MTTKETDIIVRRILSLLHANEDVLVEIDPPMDSLTYERMAARNHTYLEILNLVAETTGEDYVSMVIRVCGD